MFLKKQLVNKSIMLGFAILATTIVQAEVIFEESFDNQPDWTSGLAENDKAQYDNPGRPDIEQRAATHKIPEGWHAVRQDPQWAPSTGHPDRHEAIEILASNADKSRGGRGKSFVSWRDAYNPGWNRWNSESMLLKYLPEGYSQLYVEFWIKFGPNWTREHVAGPSAAASKLFRISSWRGDGSEFQAFPNGDIGPIALWDYSLSSYGVRNTISWRGGPHGDNYNLKEGAVPDLPASLINTGDLNLSFSRHLKGMGVGGTDPQLPDRVNGGFIDLNSSSVITHNQVFGPNGSWTKIGILVKMNSAPGVEDGVYKQWINDEQTFVSTKIPWIRPSDTEDENAKWNLVAIGGNDFFQIYPNEDRHEEWYAIDDLVIRTDVPADIGSGTVTPPNPPAGFEVR
tara:strand:+ start:4558 stop:5751 length:1194 start_codon:yes stop_codon:yes gene_type:complete